MVQYTCQVFNIYLSLSGALVSGIWDRSELCFNGMTCEEAKTFLKFKISPKISGYASWRLMMIIIIVHLTSSPWELYTPHCRQPATTTTTSQFLGPGGASRACYYRCSAGFSAIPPDNAPLSACMRCRVWVQLIPHLWSLSCDLCPRGADYFIRR